MRECHVCHYVCEDDTDICPICGAELQDNEQSDEKVDIKEIVNPVLAVSVDSPVTAEIFKDILADNEIPYSTDGNGDIIHTGFGGSYFAIDIFVDEKDLDTAKELYRNLAESQIEFDDSFDEETDGE